MLQGLTLGLLLGYTVGEALRFDEGIILGSAINEVLGSTCGASGSTDPGALDWCF